MKGSPVHSPRLRRLSDEEIELWTHVATSVTPRPGASLPRQLMAPPAAPSNAAPPAATTVAAPPTRPVPATPPPFAPLERTLKRKLSRGRMTADVAIDLHGYRQDQAYSALRHFLLQAQAGGARVALVVTGKGGRGGEAFGDGAGVGVLKRAVPLWLALPDFRHMVVGFEEAGRPHGGAGALYVRLRRRRL